jgi:hypothetical protein
VTRWGKGTWPGCVVLVTLIACGDDSTDTATVPSAPGIADAGTDADAAPDAPPPAPDKPLPPVFEPCPPRWSVTPSEGGAATCTPGPLPAWSCPAEWGPFPVAAGTTFALDACAPAPLPPWPCPAGWAPEPLLGGATTMCAPPASPDDCTDGTFAVLGAIGCQTLGNACPAGDWPVDLPASGVVYVRAGAIGGSGTMADPFGSIQAAIDASPHGSTLAVAKGDYPETITIVADLSIRGACTTGTTLGGTMLSAGQVVTIQGGSVSIGDARITGNARGIFVQGGNLVAQRVWIDASVGAGLVAGGGKATFEDGAITSVLAGAGGEGRAVEVLGGARLEVRRSVVREAHGSGIRAHGKGTELLVEDGLVLDTLPRADKGDGFGVYVEAGATAVLERVVLTDGHHAGFVATGSGTRATLRDVVVARTRPRASDLGFGRGLEISAGAVATLERVTIDANRDSGIFVDGSTVTASDLVVRATGSHAASSTRGRALTAQNGASIAVDRAVMVENRDAAVFSRHAGTEVTLRDSIVADTRSREAGGDRGYGLMALEGGKLVGERIVLSRNRQVSVFVSDEGSNAELTDALIEDTRPLDDGDSGVGAHAASGGRIRLVRTRVERSPEAGVLGTDPGTELSLEDVAIVGVESADGIGDGDGLIADTGPHVTATRLLVDGVFSSGITSMREGSRVELSDVVVQRVKPLGEFGHGLLANGGGTLVVHRGVVADLRMMGVLVTQSSRLEASDLVVRGIREASDGYVGIGVSVQLGSTAELVRTWIDDTRLAGLFAAEEGTAVVLRDVVIERTGASPADGWLGRGAMVQKSATFTVQRVALRGNREIGLAVASGASLSGTDVFIDRTLPSEAADVFGVGLAAFLGGTVDLSRIHVRESRVAGILADHAGPMKLSSCTVSSTREGAFLEVNAAGEVTGKEIPGVADGLVVRSSPSVNVTDGLFEGCARAGILYSDGGGELRRVSSTANHFGLVTSGSPTPELFDCHIEGNDTDRIEEGVLSVPSIPPSLPVPPDAG